MHVVETRKYSVHSFVSQYDFKLFMEIEGNKVFAWVMLTVSVTTIDSTLQNICFRAYLEEFRLR